MELKSRKKGRGSITVLSKHNKMLIDKRGFVTITKGNYENMTKVKPEAILNKYFQE